MVKCKWVVLLLLSATTAGLCQISGQVSDSLSGEPLAFVNVFFSDTTLGTTTDDSGKFYFDPLPAGIYQLVFQHVGYHEKKQRIIFNEESIDLDIFLEEHPIETANIDVEEKRWVSPSDITYMHTYEIRPNQIISTAGAWEDPLKTIQSYPGIIARNDYTSNLYIRGSSPEQQAILLDGVLLKNPYRLRALGYGSLSILNPDIIQAVKLRPGGFSARTGNRMGGYISIQTAEGSSEWQHDVSVNLLSARYSARGPVTNKVRTLVSLRRTYYDWIINAITTQQVSYPYFYDIFAKITWYISDRHLLSVNLLKGKEGTKLANIRKYQGNIYADSDNWIGYYNLRGKLSESLTYQLLQAYQYNNDSLSVDISSNAFYNSYSKVRDKSLYSTLALDWKIGKKVILRTGVQHTYDEQRSNLNSKIYNQFFYIGDIRNETNLYSVYGSLYWNWPQSLEVNAGLRIDYSDSNAERVISPRFSGKYHLLSNLNFSLDRGLYYQYPEIPPDLNPVESDESKYTYKPLSTQKTDYFSMGLVYLPLPGIRTSLEYYTKHIEQLPVEVVAQIDAYDTRIVVSSAGQVKSRGLETLLSWRGDKHELNLAYTYNKSLFRRIKGADWEPLYYDNRHWFTGTVTCQLSKHFSIQSTFKYGSGFPHREMLGWTKENNDMYSIIPTTNIIRHPYRRWDVRVTYQTADWRVYGELINITNVKNFDQKMNYYYKNGDSYVLESNNIYMLPMTPNIGFRYIF